MWKRYSAQTVSTSTCMAERYTCSNGYCILCCSATCGMMATPSMSSRIASRVVGAAALCAADDADIDAGAGGYAIVRLNGLQRGVLASAPAPTRAAAPASNGDAKMDASEKRFWRCSSVWPSRSSRVPTANVSPFILFR